MTMFENYPPRKYEWRIGNHQVTVWKQHKGAEWYADVEVGGIGPSSESVRIYPKDVFEAQTMAEQVIPLVKDLEQYDQQIKVLLERRRSLVEQLGELAK